MRLIDADALLEVLNKEYIQNIRDRLVIERNINNAPTVESPPKREWVGLSKEDIEKLNDVFGYFKYGDAQGEKSVAFSKAIEAKLKEVNGYD